MKKFLELLNPFASEEAKDKKPEDKEVVQPKSVSLSETTNAQPKKAQKAEATTQSKIAEENKTVKKVSEDGIDFEPISSKPLTTFFYKKLVDKKLTILMIENTYQVVKEKDTLIKNLKTLATTGELVVIMNYGSVVRQSEIFEISSLEDITFFSNDDIVDTACLYDALIQLEALVSNQYMKIEEKEKERVRVNKVAIIAIGTCIDGCSKTTKEKAFNCFSKVVSKPGVATKYFCLTEKTFINAAELGFRSIGAIFRNY